MGTPLYEGTSPIEPPATPEEVITATEDLADKAVVVRRRRR